MQEGTEYYFLAVFCIEAIVKIVALGMFVDKGSYLRSSLFNIIDFVVIVSGYCTLLFILVRQSMNILPTL